MVIGRIITKNNRNINSLDFVEKTNKIEAIDETIPTLIVGQELRDKFNKPFSLIERTFKDIKNITWTYARNEKRNIFEIDLNKFHKQIIDKLKSDIKYIHLDVFTIRIGEVKKLISFINSNSKKIIYISKNKHIYISDGNTNVYGFSLEDIDYVGINSDKILSIIKKNRNNIFIYDDKFLSYYMKNQLDNNNFFVPYLYFISKY